METLLHKASILSPPRLNTKAGGSHATAGSTPLHHFRPLNRRGNGAWLLQAQGRGFGSSVSDKKARRREEDDDNSGNGDGDEEIPQVVFNRMIRRILFSVGTPMALGIGLLYLESSLSRAQLWRAPGWVPLLTILISFGTSALGIAYGTLSTSMDPDKEGSLLGWEQAENWPEMWKDEDDKNSSINDANSDDVCRKQYLCCPF